MRRFRGDEGDDSVGEHQIRGVLEHGSLAVTVNSETAMVTASARKKVPVTPTIATNGKNTTTGVTVEPISGLEGEEVLPIPRPHQMPLLPAQDGRD